ncbi:MAG: low molecular weight protein-tyrosine-phosphatase [Rubrivivax sp.]
MTASRRILMVCMGNICRSPTAEGVLRHKLKAAGLAGAFEVDSAGTHGHYHAGEPPDARALKHAAARGYDLSRLRARRLVEADYARFDWMFAMDEDNLAHMRQGVPKGGVARLELLMSHATRFAGVREIPDPYYGPPAGFDEVLDLVEDACDGLVARLAREAGEGTS